MRRLGVDLVDPGPSGYIGLLGQRGEHGERHPIDPRGMSLIGDRAVGERRRPQRREHGGQRVQHKAYAQASKLGVGEATAAGRGLGSADDQRYAGPLGAQPG